MSHPKKRILVTGGAGFLGSHLCETLLKRGHHVLCIDNFFTGRQQNIAHLQDFASFEIVNHDICAPLKVEVEEIYNLACPASPPHYQFDPVKTVRTSVLGAMHLLELAKNLNARILQASTSEIYGDPLVHPQKEDYWGNVNPIGPRACYDEGKRCAETLFFAYHKQYQVDICVARIFNTYGPRMDIKDGRVVSNFIVQALNNEPLTIYGDGKQTRSFCFVTDLIEGLIKLMEHPEACVGPINLGNPAEITVLELAQLVKQLTHMQGELAFKPSLVDDPRKRKPDITQAKIHLGWAPKRTLEEGLKETIAYFEEQLTLV